MDAGFSHRGKVFVSAELLAWLAGGERGVSSNSIVQHLTGIPAAGRHGMGHPYDPDDLDRCLKLLCKVPELAAEIDGMATASPEWAALIEHWDEITRSHLDEVGLGWTKARNAPKTYALMCRVLESVEKK